MEYHVTIDPRTGNLGVGDIRLHSRQSKSEVEPLVAGFSERSLDHGNGYEWLYLGKLSFGGRPATLGLCFHAGRLEQVSWNVHPCDAPSEDRWPSQEAMDSELHFVRFVLRRAGLELAEGFGKYAWGEAWSVFDPKANLASNGLRYD